MQNAERRPPPSQHERYVAIALVAALLGTAVVFRLMHLSSIPGINGDEGWWGVQATHWLHGQPFEARTTNGNPIDMAFLIPLGVLQGIGHPSFFLLRVFPAFSNLLALILGFFLVRRIFGSTTAWIQTVALAIAPTAIAHSRFCQDPSQSILWTSIVIYLCLLGLKETRRSWLYFAAALVAFAMALYTHPTNVFIAPFLVLPLYPIVKRWVPASRPGKTYFLVGGVTVAAVLAVLGLLVVWPAVKSYSGSNALLDKPWLATAWARVTAGGQWFEYIRNYGRLFSGVTIYRYFSGPHLTGGPYGVGELLVAVALAWGMARASRRGRSVLDVGLVFGWASMWLIFYLFAGPESIRPHVERWGLCLIVPATLIMGRALTTWIETGPRMRTVTIASASLIAAALLGSFYLNYFHEFETSGGRSHRTFITAATEPKQAALEQILARRTGEDRVMIIAQDWWQFWPIAYLATGENNVSVSMTLAVEGQPEYREALAHGQLFFVEFAGSEEAARAHNWIRERRLRSKTTAVQRANGKDLFEILQVSDATDPN